jgi:cytochrome P450
MSNGADRQSDGDDERDPFDAFNQAAGAGVVRDPYPIFAEMRRECPVQAGPLAERFGVPLQESMMPSERGYYTVLTYDGVQQVLLDGETFSSSGYAPTVGMLMGHSILEMDEPEHGRYRALIQQAFGLKAMEHWEAAIVAPTVHGLIDRFAERGRAELVRELTLPFPIQVIAAMLGLPAADLPQFHRWAVELISITANIARGFEASQKLRDYFAGVLAARRADPRDDLISVLAQAELDSQRLTDEEIFAFLRLLLPAGAETTYRSSSSLLFGLLTHADQLDAVRADRGLIKRAIEEGLRWEPPLTGIARLAMRDATVGGVPIPRGAVVSVCLGAANHDDKRWERPEQFDIFRDPKPHMAFAYGAHTCIGMHLARMETRVFLNALLDRLPNLRLDPDAADVHVTGLAFRAPRTLPVLFDVGGQS